MKQTLTIDGLTCPACKELILDVCSDYTELKSCQFVDEKTLTFDCESSFDIKILIDEIQNSGNYTVKK